jgi:hypothetical protein
VKETSQSADDRHTFLKLNHGQVCSDVLILEVWLHTIFARWVDADGFAERQIPRNTRLRAASCLTFIVAGFSMRNSHEATQVDSWKLQEVEERILSELPEAIPFHTIDRSPQANLMLSVPLLDAFMQSKSIMKSYHCCTYCFLSSVSC